MSPVGSGPGTDASPACCLFLSEHGGPRASSSKISNSSGPLANSHNGEPFRKRIDRQRQHGGGSPPSTWFRSMKRRKRLCAIDYSFRLVRHTPPAPRCCWRRSPIRPPCRGRMNFRARSSGKKNWIRRNGLQKPGPTFLVVRIFSGINRRRRIALAVFANALFRSTNLVDLLPPRTETAPAV